MSTAATIERTTFTTSRLLDFVSVPELTKQCGYDPDDWPLVVVKELIDNALDATEEQGIPPEITVTVTKDSITVADNGSGIPPATVDQLLDFSIRVSSREAYVAPDRGAQGNALKTLVAMPFVLDGDEGHIEIVGGGYSSKIAFSVDRIAQCPAADIKRSRKKGSLIRLRWPDYASSGDEDGCDVFTSQCEAALDDNAFAKMRMLVEDFAFLNPHADLTFKSPHERVFISGLEFPNSAWEKWTPSDPTSPHWYEPEHLERLLGAYITHDRQADRPERTVREFVSEFKGLSSTIRQRDVLADVGLSRAPLSDLLSEDGRDFDHEKVAGLLAAMRAHCKPVGPRQLGAIGSTNLKTRFEPLGIHKGSFEYKKVASLGENGLPQVTEVAFAALQDEDARRRLITGVNWSAAWVNPFRRLGDYGQSLDTMMTERRFAFDQPIALLIHVAHPRVEYSDRGKSTVITR